MSCENCIKDEIIEQMREDIKVLYSKSNQTENKLTELSLDSKYMKATLDDVKKMVEKIAEKPSKRWELVITTIITNGVACIVGLVIGMLIKKG